MAYDPMDNLRTVLTGYMKQARPLEEVLFVRDKVALVTGGTSGLGFDIALRLLQGGAKVVIASGSAQKGATALKLLEEAGYEGRVFFKQTDVSEEDQVVDLVAYIDQTLGSLDIFVNSVGIWSYAHVYDMLKSDFERVLQVNTVGLFLCIKHISRYMIDHKIHGKITLISSNSAWLPYPVFGGYPHYAASKGGVNSLAIEAAKELKRFGIMVNVVAPGGMVTAGASSNMCAQGLSEEKQDEFYEELMVWQNDGTQAVDTVAIVAYAMSTPMSDGMTGEIVVADAGMSHNIVKYQAAIEQYPETLEEEA